MFAQQMQAIQSRFEHLLQQQQMAKDSVAANEARRQNRRLRNEHNKSVETNEKLAQSNESIAQLEAEVSQLVVAFRELKTQTDIQLQALAHQADRTRVAEESIAAYRAALDAAERRLAESAAIRVARQPSHVAADYPRMSESSAGRVYLDESPATDFAAPAAPVPKVPVPPTPFEFPVQRPAPSPKAVQPASPKPNAEGTRFFQPEPEPVPQGKPFPDDRPSAELSTQQEFVPQDQNRYRLEITESDAESLPTLPSLEETGNDLSAEVRNDVSSMRSAFLSDQDQMTVPVPPIMDELDSADESFAELVSPLQALELVPSIEQPKELHSVPEDFEREIPRMDRGAPVAFEHVYRFKLTDVQDGKAVVPADGAVCVHCGRVHNGNGKQGTCDTPQAITTTAYVPQSTPRADGDQKAGSSNRPDYRNAARGTNRHVNRTQQPKPPAQPKRTTQNKQDDQPSLLHRMSSSLFNWSRSSVE